MRSTRVFFLEMFLFSAIFVL